MAVLEEYEWCNFWFDRANDQTRRRILLVGDSITNSYRHSLTQSLGYEYCVDMIASSRSIDNPIIQNELDYMLKMNGFDYECIHFNNGLHGWHLSVNEYEKHYEKVIRYIQKIYHNKLIIALTTPMTVAGDVKAISEKYNPKVIERNQAVSSLCKKYNFILNDLYTPCYGKSEYRISDGYHYNEIGRKALGDIVAKVVLKTI